MSNLPLFLLPSGDRFFHYSRHSIDVVGEIVDISTSSLRQLSDSHLGYGAALTDLGEAHYRSLATPAMPGDFLHRQREIGGDMLGRTRSYFESVRSILMQTHQAYLKLGRELAAEMGAKTA